MHPIPRFRHGTTIALLSSAVALAGCDAEGGSAPVEPSSAPAAFAEAPATGNGHKLVIPIDEDEPNINCGGGDILELHIKGWIQVRTFPARSKPFPAARPRRITRACRAAPSKAPTFLSTPTASASCPRLNTKRLHCVEQTWESATWITSLV